MYLAVVTSGSSGKSWIEPAFESRTATFMFFFFLSFKGFNGLINLINSPNLQHIIHVKKKWLFIQLWWIIPLPSCISTFEANCQRKWGIGVYIGKPSICRLWNMKTHLREWNQQNTHSRKHLPTYTYSHPRVCTTNTFTYVVVSTLTYLSLSLLMLPYVRLSVGL